MEEFNMDTLKSPEDSHQNLRPEILEKTRSFYQLHFMFLDAVFGAQAKPYKHKKQTIREHMRYRCSNEVGKYLVSRIRLISSTTFTFKHREIPHRIWVDVLSITP